MQRLEARVDIAAPLELVWRVVLDLERYGEWNPFLPRIDGLPRVGAMLVLHARAKGGGIVVSRELVTRVEPPEHGRALFEYSFRGPLHTFGAVRARRRQTLERAGDVTRYESVQQFRGWLEAALPVAHVRAGLEAHAEALKLRAQALLVDAA